MTDDDFSDEWGASPEGWDDQAEEPLNEELREERIRPPLPAGIPPWSLGVFAALVFGTLFFPGSGDEVTDLFVGRLCDAGHVPLFFLVTLAIYAAVSRRRSFEVRLSVAALTTAAFIIGTELIQPLVGRSGSAVDILNGILGEMAALLGLVLWPFRRNLAVAGAYAAGCAGAAVLALLPAYRVHGALSRQQSNLPVLASFDNAQDLLLWRPADEEAKPQVRFEIVSDFSGDRRSALKIETASGSWSGVSYLLNDMSWAGSKRLRFQVYNPAEPFIIKVRIDDMHSDARYESRFNTGLQLETGMNDIQLPLNFVADGPKDRDLDLEHLRKFYLFVSPSEPGRTFWLSNLRLE